LQYLCNKGRREQCSELVGQGHNGWFVQIKGDAMDAQGVAGSIEGNVCNTKRLERETGNSGALPTIAHGSQSREVLHKQLTRWNTIEGKARE
jgi:hypothetical protein